MSWKLSSRIFSLIFTDECLVARLSRPLRVLSLTSMQPFLKLTHLTLLSLAISFPLTLQSRRWTWTTVHYHNLMRTERVWMFWHLDSGSSSPPHYRAMPKRLLLSGYYLIIAYYGWSYRGIGCLEYRVSFF